MCILTPEEEKAADRQRNFETSTYGIVTTIIDKVLDRLGISQERVEKLNAVIDNIKNIDIQEHGEKTVISIDMNKITIVIDK